MAYGSRVAASGVDIRSSQFNRRMVLLGGTTITAASAMVSAGRAAEGETTGPQRREDCISYFPNENLAQAIVKAWSEESYQDQLLTFGRAESTRRRLSRGP